MIIAEHLTSFHNKNEKNCKDYNTHIKTGLYSTVPYLRKASFRIRFLPFEIIPDSDPTSQNIQIQPDPDPQYIQQHSHSP